MANFDLAFRFMAPHEWNQRRNFTNDPDDPGGPTKWGITLKSWQLQGSLGDLDHDGDVDVDDLNLATEDHARHFYAAHYWVWESITDDRLAAKLFDIGVNLGPETATRYLQQAVGNVVIDGKLGPKTIVAANAADPSVLLSRLVDHLAQHYREWIAKDPKREKYRAGLMARADALPMIEGATHA